MARRALSNVLGELKSLGDRSGSALGAAYALAARSVLGRWERLEDLRAEQRFRRRSSARSPGAVPTARKALPSANAPASKPVSH